MQYIRQLTNILTCLTCLHPPPKQTLPASDFRLLIFIDTRMFTNVDRPPTSQSLPIRLFRSLVVPRLRPFVHRNLAEFGASCASGSDGVESLGTRTLVTKVGGRFGLRWMGGGRNVVVS